MRKLFGLVLLGAMIAGTVACSAQPPTGTNTAGYSTQQVYDRDDWRFRNYDPDDWRFRRYDPDDWRFRRYDRDDWRFRRY